MTKLSHPSNEERMVFQKIPDHVDFHAEKTFESYLVWYPKINSRCILDLNGEDKTIKFLVPNTEKYLYHLGVGRDFLVGHIKHQSIEKKLTNQILLK